MAKIRLRTKPNSQNFIEMINATGREAFPYSGRNMYGAQCVAVSVDKSDDCRNLPPNPVIDSMGLGLVLYWPASEWPAE
jgi:hypothetical protein